MMRLIIEYGSRKNNGKRIGAGLGYFGVGAAAGALYLTPGGQAVAGSVQVVGNKGIQIATGKFDVTEINSVGDVATLGLDIATDYFSVAPAATIGSNLASGLQKLAGSYAPSVASGGGSVVKTAAGGTVDDITFSVSLSDEVVVSASKLGGKGVAAGASTQGVNRIYSARELVRRSAEPGPFHNFPEVFNKTIFQNGTKTITPNYFNVAKPGLSNTNILYRYPGTINGTKGFYEIGVRPSLSGRTEVIMHRFFNPIR